jgi:hypothetical protein
VLALPRVVGRRAHRGPGATPHRRSRGGACVGRRPLGPLGSLRSRFALALRHPDLACQVLVRPDPRATGDADGPVGEHAPAAIPRLGNSNEERPRSHVPALRHLGSSRGATRWPPAQARLLGPELSSRGVEPVLERGVEIQELLRVLHRAAVVDRTPQLPQLGVVGPGLLRSSGSKRWHPGLPDHLRRRTSQRAP